MRSPATFVHVLLALCLGALAYQTYALEQIKTHHWFAVKTVDELTFVEQQCESTLEQCCK